MIPYVIFSTSGAIALNKGMYGKKFRISDMQSSKYFDPKSKQGLSCVPVRYRIKIGSPKCSLPINELPVAAVNSTTGTRHTKEKIFSLGKPGRLAAKPKTPKGNSKKCAKVTKASRKLAPASQDMLSQIQDPETPPRNSYNYVK